MRTVTGLSVFVLMALFVTGPAMSQTAEAHQVHQALDAEQQIKTLNTFEVDALLRNDVDTLNRLWSNDFVVTNPFNKFIDKKQVMGMTASGNLAFSAYDRRLEYVRVHGDIAVVSGAETVAWAGKMLNAGTTSRLRFTAVWMKQDGRWQQIARHASVIAPQ